MATLKKGAPVPPLPPHLAAYEPYEFDEDPLFEQVSLVGMQEWPEYDEMPWRFDTCKLESCSLMSKTIQNVRIWDSILVRCDLSANKFFDAGLLRNEFLGCRLTGVQLGESSIKDITFQNCKLNMANFRKCKLDRVIFQNCILDDVDFNNARLTDVVFSQCELNRTDFSGMHALRVDLSGSDISFIRGVTSLRNVRIAPEQMVQLAPLLCAEVGIQLA